MGTRADFYIGRGQDAEWLGSVAWDGYEWFEEPTGPLMSATTPEEFRGALVEVTQRDDFTAPERGWPWPWDDSRTTDFAYVLHEGKVTAYCFGEDASDGDADKVDWFPDMSARKNVARDSTRSGVIVVRG